MRISVYVVPTRFNTNSPVLYQKKARSFKFTIKEEESLYYLCSENEDPDQLCNCCSALGLLFSHIHKNPVFRVTLLVLFVLQVSYHPGHDDLVHKIITQAFRHFKYKDG